MCQPVSTHQNFHLIYSYRTIEQVDQIKESKKIKKRKKGFQYLKVVDDVLLHQSLSVISSWPIYSSFGEFITTRCFVLWLCYSNYYNINFYLIYVHCQLYLYRQEYYGRLGLEGRSRQKRTDCSVCLLLLRGFICRHHYCLFKVIIPMRSPMIPFK